MSIFKRLFSPKKTITEEFTDPGLIEAMKDVQEIRFNKLFGMFTHANFTSLIMGMNDTFGFGCADAEEMSVSDFFEVYPLYEKYGHAALIAYASVKRNEDPLKQLITSEYKAAKRELELLANCGLILFEEYFHREGLEKAAEAAKLRTERRKKEK